MIDEELKKEFSRWIDAGRPQTWYKKNDEWIVLYADPKWLKDGIYIVDDEYAELRKAFYDGKTIQTAENSGWMDWNHNKPPTWVKPVDYYRVKTEEPVYEWQYARPLYSTRYTLDGNFYTEEEALDTWFKIEPSKRVRKD